MAAGILSSPAADSDDFRPTKQPLHQPTKTMKCNALTLVLSFLLPSLAPAWHDEGHQAVAAVAWDQMTPQARTRAMALLGNAPANSGIAALRPTTGSAGERDRIQFIRAATWADKVRVGARKPIYHKGSWHYTDYFWEQQAPGGTKRQRPDVPPHGDMVRKLPALEASLRSAGTAPVSPSKATDLAWFLHLMGDIAQPLHASGRITALDPNGDQGGNFFCLSAARDAEGDCRNNLHSYWDDVIEREYGHNADMRQVASAIEQSRPRTAFTRLGLGQYESWARSSQKIAVQAAYPATLVRNSAPPPQYREMVKRVCEKTIALGGYRLGETLNSIFAH